MTIQGVIAELQNLLKVDDIPFYYKGGIEKVIETIQMEIAEQTEPQKCDDCIWSVCNYNKVDWERAEQTMSGDLIKRSDAIGACAYETIECYEARKAIRALPSADRLQGEWIDKGWKGDWQFETDGRGNCWKVFECSVCNGWKTSRTRFCPHCGARMKGEDDE